MRRLNGPWNALSCLSKNAAALLLCAGPASSASMNKSSTLPLPHRLGLERPSSSAGRDREGYYSDRNELIREREREREKERERGYLSDHNSRYNEKYSFFFVSLLMISDFSWNCGLCCVLSFLRKSDESIWTTDLGTPKFSVKYPWPNATLSTINCSGIKAEPLRWEVTKNRLRYDMTLSPLTCCTLSQVHFLSRRIGPCSVVSAFRWMEVGLRTKHSQAFTLGLSSLPATWRQFGGQRIQIQPRGFFRTKASVVYCNCSRCHIYSFTPECWYKIWRHSHAVSLPGNCLVLYTYGTNTRPVARPWTLLVQRLPVRVHICKNLSLCGPWGLHEVEAPSIFWQSAHEGGKVVSHTQRPLLPPRKIPSTHFC